MDAVLNQLYYIGKTDHKGLSHSIVRVLKQHPTNGTYWVSKIAQPYDRDGYGLGAAWVLPEILEWHPDDLFWSKLVNISINVILRKYIGWNAEGGMQDYEITQDIDSDVWGFVEEWDEYKAMTDEQQEFTHEWFFEGFVSVRREIYFTVNGIQLKGTD